MPIPRSTLSWIVLWLCVSGCGGPALFQYEKRVEDASPAAAHAVHEERLRALMRRLDRLRDERLPNALDAEVEKQRQSREVARVARAMAESARGIATAAPAGLSPEEAREFRVLAEELERRSEALADDVPSLTRPQRSERLAEIDVICGSCHARFRVRGGPVAGR